jgi:trafficking protein particle complex subunit 2
MSHHLFIVSQDDTPLYSLTHQSSKPNAPPNYPLSANLPTWSSSAFASTLTAFSGASSVNQPASAGAAPRVGSGQDRYVVQMIAHASLDSIEEVVRINNAMSVMFLGQLNCTLITFWF